MIRLLKQPSMALGIPGVGRRPFSAVASKPTIHLSSKKDLVYHAKYNRCCQTLEVPYDCKFDGVSQQKKEEMPSEQKKEMPKPDECHTFNYIYLLLSYTSANVYLKELAGFIGFPWICSAILHALGSYAMLAAWAVGLLDPPDTDLHFWGCLLPVAVANTIGYLAFFTSILKVPLCFTHTVACLEPAFSLVVSPLILGNQSVPSTVYMSLPLILGGVSLAAATELKFNIAGFAAAVVSSLAFAVRDALDERGIRSGKVAHLMGTQNPGLNYHACLSMMSLAMVLPFALIMEGPQFWAAGAHAVEHQPVRLFSFIKMFFGVIIWYNRYYCMAFPNKYEPTTFVIGNTLKKIVVIVVYMTLYKVPLRSLNILGTTLAILGVSLYSREIGKTTKMLSWML